MRSITKSFILASVVGGQIFPCAAIVHAETAKADLPRYQSSIGLIELEGCGPVGNGARCIVWVNTSKKFNWWFSKNNALYDQNGTAIPATRVTVAGVPQSIAALTQIGKGVDLEPGIRTRIVYDFEKPMNFRKVQGFAITLGRWNNTYPFPHIPELGPEALAE